jgi:hypothetical protein
VSGEPFSVRSGVRTAGPVVFLRDAGFATPAPGGNGAGRNLFTAPSYWNMDMSMIKRFRLTESGEHLQSRELR